jgi:hypothetical protein
MGHASPSHAVTELLGGLAPLVAPFTAGFGPAGAGLAILGDVPAAVTLAGPAALQLSLRPPHAGGGVASSYAEASEPRGSRTAVLMRSAMRSAV